MIRGARFPDLFTSAFEIVGVNGPGFPQVVGVDRSVRIEPAGDSQHNPGSPNAFRFEPDPAGDVLAEVENINPGPGFSQFDRLEFLLFAHRRAG